MPTDLGLDTELESVENTSGTATGFAHATHHAAAGLVESSGIRSAARRCWMPARITAWPNWTATGAFRRASFRAPFRPGAMTAYAASSAPSGWLLCDGAAVSRSTYADLYGVVGDTYGAGNGSTTFNVPDTRRRAIVGVGGRPAQCSAIRSAIRAVRKIMT